eukprot:comp20913_c0_seq1/m.43564 comp20913_c0_seq1/g.43564  ORF comp20913_c0_seq1/g.43564 comp20913_c0_seq1/m.43564 type:complete len:360 (+) comp20913_c0_seq1:784-1863(+)
MQHPPEPARRVRRTPQNIARRNKKTPRRNRRNENSALRGTRGWTKPSLLARPLSLPALKGNQPARRRHRRIQLALPNGPTPRQITHRPRSRILAARKIPARPRRRRNPNHNRCLCRNVSRKQRPPAFPRISHNQHPGLSLRSHPSLNHRFKHSPSSTIDPLPNRPFPTAANIRLHRFRDRPSHPSNTDIHGLRPNPRIAPNHPSPTTTSSNPTQRHPRRRNINPNQTTPVFHFNINRPVASRRPRCLPQTDPAARAPLIHKHSSPATHPLRSHRPRCRPLALTHRHRGKLCRPIDPSAARNHRRPQKSAAPAPKPIRRSRASRHPAHRRPRADHPAQAAHRPARKRACSRQRTPPRAGK